MHCYRIKRGGGGGGDAGKIQIARVDGEGDRTKRGSVSASRRARDVRTGEGLELHLYLLPGHSMPEPLV